MIQHKHKQGRPSWLSLCLVLIAFILGSGGVAMAEGNAQRSALLLLKTTSPQGSEVTFGSGASSSAAARALREPFEALGIRFVSSPAVAAAADDAPKGLPLSDAAALAMAAKAGTDICVVAGIAVAAKGKIRATQLRAYLATLRIRVLDVKTGAALVDVSTRRHAYAQDAGQGSTAAIAGSITLLGTDFSRKLRAHWPPASESKGAASVVRITGAQGWRPVAAVLKQLAASKGIQFVHALEIQGDQVQLAVSTTMSSGSLVALLQRTRIHDGSVAVVSSGNTITMSIRMSATTSIIDNG